MSDSLLSALKPFAWLCEMHDDEKIADSAGMIFPGSAAVVKMGDLRRARRVYLLAAGSAEPSGLADPVDALADAMWQLLDDMGDDGLSVCPGAKAQARIAYEPFSDPDAPLAFTVERARAAKEASDA